LLSLDTRYVTYEFVPAIFDHKNSVVRNVNGSEMEAKVVRSERQLVPKANSNYLKIARQMAVARNEITTQKFLMTLRTTLFRTFSLTYGKVSFVFCVK